MRDGARLAKHASTYPAPAQLEPSLHLNQWTWGWRQAKADMVAFSALKGPLQAPLDRGGHIPGVEIGSVHQGKGGLAILGIHASICRGIYSKRAPGLRRCFRHCEKLYAPCILCRGSCGCAGWLQHGRPSPTGCLMQQRCLRAVQQRVLPSAGLLTSCGRAPAGRAGGRLRCACPGATRTTATPARASSTRAKAARAAGGCALLRVMSLCRGLKVFRVRGQAQRYQSRCCALRVMLHRYLRPWDFRSMGVANLHAALQQVARCLLRECTCLGCVWFLCKQLCQHATVEWTGMVVVWH